VFLTYWFDLVQHIGLSVWPAADVSAVEVPAPSIPSSGKLRVLQETSRHVRIHTCSGLL
jgi:hypothetical protein